MYNYETTLNCEVTWFKKPETTITSETTKAILESNDSQNIRSAVDLAITSVTGTTDKYLITFSFGNIGTNMSPGAYRISLVNAGIDLLPEEIHHSFMVTGVAQTNTLNLTIDL